MAAVALVTYIGPYPEIEVWLSDGDAVLCRKGEQVELPQCDLDGMNPDNWQSEAQVGRASAADRARMKAERELRERNEEARYQADRRHADDRVRRDRERRLGETERYRLDREQRQKLGLPERPSALLAMRTLERAERDAADHALREAAPRDPTRVKRHVPPWRSKRTKALIPQVDDEFVY